MKKKLYQDEQWLREQYWEKELTIAQMAKLANCSTGAICNWMKKNNIPPRYKLNREGICANRDWLHEQYWEQELSPSEIAKIANCAIHVVIYWLKEHDIPCRTGSQASILRDKKRFQNRIYRNKEWLYKQYWRENLGIAQIAVKANAGQGTIVRWMDIYKIPRRHERLDEKWRIKRLEKKKKLRRNPAHYMGRKHIKKWMDSNWLYEQYWQNNLDIAMIAELCHCSPMTICNWMRRQNIPRRAKTEIGLQRYEGGLYRNRNWLYAKYCDEKLSAPHIAELCNVGKTTIYEWLEKHDIPRRDYKESSCACWVHGRHDHQKRISTGQPTWIEVTVSNVLDNVKLDHESQYKPKECRFIFDEFTPPNILVELHGTYWHGHEKPEVQKRDKKKAQWVKDNGYTLVVLWEHEIKGFGAWPLVRNRILPLCEDWMLTL